MRVIGSRFSTHDPSRLTGDNAKFVNEPELWKQTEDLVRKVRETQLTEKDPEAEQLLQNGLGSDPDAIYKLAQTVLVQNLALIQTIFGENSRAISTLTRLLQTPFDSWIYPTTITPALLRLDPLWDPLRSDPAFQKLCGGKQP